MYNFDLTIEYDNDEEYRQQILKVFNLSEYTDEITKGIDSVYEDIRENERFSQLLEKRRIQCFRKIRNWVWLSCFHMITLRHFTNVLRNIKNKK